MVSEIKLPAALESSRIFTGRFLTKLDSSITYPQRQTNNTISLLASPPRQGLSLCDSPPLLRALCYHPRQLVTEMGVHDQSLAPSCPPIPGLGLAAFCTSHSISWVLPIAQIETRSRIQQILFFVGFYFPPFCRCFSRIYSSQQNHPHCSLLRSLICVPFCTF